MNLPQIGTIVTACILSAGGIGGIVIAAIHFSSKFIADRLSSKYENKLEKALERYKTELSKKEYVSKTRFDTEFRMYQELSGKNLSMVYCAGESVVITRGAPYSANEVDQFIEKYCSQLNDAEMTNKRYAPFIAKEIYEKYLSLEKKASEIFRLLKFWKQYQTEDGFSVIIDKTTYHNQAEITQAIADKQKMLSDDSDALLCDLREYLSKLDVLED